ncbi:hypothetical protein VNI00_012905 [Paramarasmius palmivorus]|uniref:Uncharacterized protein n=1 Tax=Paramarasmius palmivorus TaxID=297713 RepID=A0AAW0C3R0_9AGAR
MRHFRYFLVLFLVVLCLTEVLSAPAKSKKPTKALAAAAKKPPAKKPAAAPKKPVAAAKKPAAKKPAATKKPTTVKKPTTTKKPAATTKKTAATTKKPATTAKKPTTTTKPATTAKKSAATAKPATAAKKPATTAKPATPPKKPAAPACPVKSSGSKLAPRADPAEAGCAKQTTCTKCVAVKGSCGTPVCGFTEEGKCVGVSSAPAGAAKNAAECKALDAKLKENAAADAEFVTAAKNEFAKIKPHVFGTEKGLKNTSGRHLASALIAPAANKALVATRVENTDTGLSQFSTAGGKKKTTWDDDNNRYSKAEVQTMCEEAIKSVLKLKDTKTLPKGTAITSVSVRSPRGMNLCISVQGNTSVFPGSTNPTVTTPGQQCRPDAGVGDE